MYEIKASKTGWVPEGESEKETVSMCLSEAGLNSFEDSISLYDTDEMCNQYEGSAKKRTVELIVRVWDEEDRILAD